MTIKINSFGIGVEGTYDGDNEAIEKLKEIRRVETPDLLSNQNVNIDLEERDNTIISFADDNADNGVFAEFGNDEGTIKVNIIFEEDNEDSFSGILNELAVIMPDAETRLSLRAEESVEFSELDLPFDNSSDYSLSGIRLRGKEYEYVLQDIGENTTGVVLNVTLDKLDDLDRKNLIEPHLITLREFMEAC